MAPVLATKKGPGAGFTGFCHRRNRETLDANSPSPSSLGPSSRGPPMRARRKTGYQRILDFVIHPIEADDDALADSAQRRIQHCMLTDDRDFQLLADLQR